eukprot:TRINITY_DN1325_c0_g1_i2.p1 TRINITY_DN1325_c0_g1~~TRINITY_DN1325_c0_g1_i2.p1  ORF type:complete len:621 (-),score=179.60 TRINITY_DN1325_c0_g1_i2:59-1921(-)
MQYSTQQQQLYSSQEIYNPAGITTYAVNQPLLRSSQELYNPHITTVLPPHHSFLLPPQQQQPLRLSQEQYQQQQHHQQQQYQQQQQQYQQPSLRTSQELHNNVQQLHPLNSSILLAQQQQQQLRSSEELHNPIITIQQQQSPQRPLLRSSQELYNNNSPNHVSYTPQQQPLPQFRRSSEIYMSPNISPQQILYVQQPPQFRLSQELNSSNSSSSSHHAYLQPVVSQQRRPSQELHSSHSSIPSPRPYYVQQPQQQQPHLRLSQELHSSGSVPQQRPQLSASQELYSSSSTIYQQHQPQQQQQYQPNQMMYNNTTPYNNWGFTTLNNFRDLSESTASNGNLWLKPRMLFRSATLDHASEEEIHRLCHDININTIIDLRSEVEIKTAKDQGRAFVSFPSTVVSHLKKKDLAKTELMDRHKDKAVVQRYSDHKTIMINFAGRRYRQYAVIYAAPMRIKLKLVELMANDQKAAAVTLVGREVLSPKGLIGLYRDFIDYCYYEIGEALKYLADIKNYPVLVHCTQGKDRTGLVIALALYACRVPEVNIIHDYALTTQGLAPIKHKMVEEMARDGLNPVFSDSPPEVLQETFAYIKEKYGSVQNYLDRTKFTTVYREALRRILLPY